MAKKPATEPASIPEVQPAPPPAVEPQPTIQKTPLVWEAVAAISYPPGESAPPPSQQGCSGVACDWEHAAIGAMRHFNRKNPGASIALIKVVALAEISFTNI